MADRDRATDTGRSGPSNGSRADFMMEMPGLMEPTTTAAENAAGGWNGVNAPEGGMAVPTRTVGSRGVDDD